MICKIVKKSQRGEKRVRPGVVVTGDVGDLAGFCLAVKPQLMHLLRCFAASRRIKDTSRRRGWLQRRIAKFIVTLICWLF